MSHETIIYGFIEGATYSADEYRVLQARNIDVLEQLPLEFDEYPGISREMFSWPPQEPMKGGWRAQVIHFGGSYKNIDSGYSDISTWVDKFERVLAKLYWFGAAAHILTELIGDLTFVYDVDDEIINTYRNGTPCTTNKWKRKFFKDNAAEEFNP